MLQLRNASYTYPAGGQIGPVSFDVGPGQLVLLTGPTGCGKSTLLRLAAGLLGRHGHGQIGGDVRVGGEDPARLAPSARVAMLGFVSQDPSDQIATGTIADEIAFGLESMGLPSPQIEARVIAAMTAMALPEEPDRSTQALSGGQKQRLVVAAALAGGGRLLILDEPLAQLDPAAAESLLIRLRALADEGVAVLMVEHRLELAMPTADRLILMDRGALVWQGSAAEAPIETLRALGLSVPGVMDLEDRLGRQGIYVVEAYSLLQAGYSAMLVTNNAPGLDSTQTDAGENVAAVLVATDLRFSWGNEPVLRGISLSLHPGERVALLGANGAGKSTLLAALAGQIQAGRVTRSGPVVDVPQDPDLALFCETVGQELAYGPKERRLDPGLADRAAEALSVSDLSERPPQALSRGQRSRVAVAAALACDPIVLMLDEPTSGQDRDQVERLMFALRARRDAALIFATHDIDLALRHATRWIVLHEGRVVAEGSPAETLARLPAEVPLRLPPLAAWCLAHDLPIATAEELVSWL